MDVNKLGSAVERGLVFVSCCIAEIILGKPPPAACEKIGSEGDYQDV